MSALGQRSHRQILPGISTSCVHVPGRGAAAPRSLPPGGPPRPARVCPGSRGHCFPCWGPVHLVCPSRSGVSASPGPMVLLHSNPTDLPSRVLWGLVLTMPEPLAGSLLRGLTLPLMWENFCDILFSSLWVTHPGGIGSDYRHMRPSHQLVVISWLCLWI